MVQKNWLKKLVQKIGSKKLVPKSAKILVQNIGPKNWAAAGRGMDDISAGGPDETLFLRAKLDSLWKPWEVDETPRKSMSLSWWALIIDI